MLLLTLLNSSGPFLCQHLSTFVMCTNCSINLLKGTIFIRNSMLGIHHTTRLKSFWTCDKPLEFFIESETTLSWNTRISTVVRNGLPFQALDMFKTMLLYDRKPEFLTILGVLRAAHSEFVLTEIHGLLIKLGLESDVSVTAMLDRSYSFWNFCIVWKLFDQITNKDQFPWTSMILLCLKSKRYMEALDLFIEMQNWGTKPNHTSLLSILPVCANVKTLSLGKQIHSFSMCSALFHHTSVKNSLLDMYAKCGNLKASSQIFKGIEGKDLVSWKRMIWACIENSSPRMALCTLSDMHFSGTELDENIILGSISACSSTEEVQFAEEIHCYALKKRFLCYVSVGTALLHMYGKFGEVSSAINIFEKIHPKDHIAWSAMISVHAQDNNFSKVLDTFYQMKLANEKPNEFTFVSLLKACSSTGDIDLANSIHSFAIKSRYSSNPFISQSLIEFYCRMGEVSHGREVFDEMPIKDIVSWNSMIKGYGLNGLGKEALETFSDMLKCKIVPNEISFISILSACSHCGLEFDGWELFDSMKDRHNVTPKLEHYACMVDSLSRRGKVKEAFEFVKSMPLEPDEQIWGSILAGCRSSSGCIEIVKFVVDKLKDLNPDNMSYDVSITNLYAEQGRWGAVEKMRASLDENGLKNTAGFSMVEQF